MYYISTSIYTERVVLFLIHHLSTVSLFLGLWENIESRKVKRGSCSSQWNHRYTFSYPPEWAMAVTKEMSFSSVSFPPSQLFRTYQIHYEKRHVLLPCIKNVISMSYQCYRQSYNNLQTIHFIKSISVLKLLLITRVILGFRI